MNKIEILIKDKQKLMMFVHNVYANIADTLIWLWKKTPLLQKLQLDLDDVQKYNSMLDFSKMFHAMVQSFR